MDWLTPGNDREPAPSSRPEGNLLISQLGDALRSHSVMMNIQDVEVALKCIGAEEQRHFLFIQYLHLLRSVAKTTMIIKYSTHSLYVSVTNIHSLFILET